MSVECERKFDMSVSEKPLHIDIPVRLAEVKIVYQYRCFGVRRGSSRFAFFTFSSSKDDIADWNAKGNVIAVFHTNAGHVTLHDSAYNADRGIATGNPYKDLVADLMKRGAQIELCGATAKAHNWGNEDLLPGIDVNTDAMARTTQLVQEGFVKITE